MAHVARRATAQVTSRANAALAVRNDARSNDIEIDRKGQSKACRRRAIGAASIPSPRRMTRR